MLSDTLAERESLQPAHADNLITRAHCPGRESGPTVPDSSGAAGLFLCLRNVKDAKIMSTEKQAQRDALLAKAQAIDTGAEATGRALSDDELTKQAEIIAEARTLGDELEAEAKADTLRVDAKAALAEELNRGVAVKSSTPAQVAGSGHVITAEPAGVHEPNGGYERPEHFYFDVLAAAQTQQCPERLNFFRSEETQAHRDMWATVGSDEQSTFANPWGGFLIPEGHSPELLQVGFEPDPTASLTRNIPMSADTISIAARVDKNHSSSVSGGLEVKWRAEADTVTATRMQFEMIEHKANMIFGTAFATEELLQRSPISFVALLASGFGDEFGAKLADGRIRGTGVGQFAGVLGSAAKIQVAKEAGQTPDSIVAENLYKMRSRSWGYRNAVWMVNHDAFPQLAELNQAVGTGGQTIWQPSMREDHPGMILGRPLIVSEFANTVGDADDVMLINWREYLESQFTPMQNASSIHVRFLNHETAFKVWMETAGTPWWRSALTPKNGSTLSPIVTLAERA